jgi:glycosyltransferase involved in cell wall biosynthesis
LGTLNPMNDQGSTQKTILFSGHDLKFIRAFVAHCESDSGYRVLIDQHTGHEINSSGKCLELLPSADVIFCEWCLGNAKWYSQRKRPDQRLIIRLHHQEMGLPYRYELEWDNVDALIFTNFPHYNRFCREQPEHSDKAVVIFCDVDCEALDQDKLPGAEFNLGLVGINPMRKRPDLASEVLAKLHRTDSRYTLFFKTRMPWEYEWLWGRPHERDYFEGCFAMVEASPQRNSVVFDAHDDDMPLWYSKIGFILSTSDHEGSHQAVAEGMAAGCIPIIRNWNGATPLYPPRFVFSSVEEAAQLIREFRRPQFYTAVAAEAKAYARAHFDQPRIFDKIEALFDHEFQRSRPVVASDYRTEQPAPAIPPVMVLCYLPAGFRGGYRIRVEQEIRSLTHHGCQVHLACLHPGSADPSALAVHCGELEGLGCVVHLVPVARFFDIQLTEAVVGGALDALQRIAEDNHLRIIHAEALYCTRIGILLKQRCPNLRLVFDCHGTSPEEERMSGAHPSRVSALEEWERRALADADLNVFVSEAMHDFFLKRYQFSRLPHIVVPSCVADERFPDENTPCALSLPTKRSILAYLGTMATWQCGDEMIRLFAQLQRHDPKMFFLLLVPRCDHPKTRHLITKYLLAEDSVLLTELPHEQIAATLQYAHAGVLLRRTHPVNEVSSPTKFGEYLAAGVPVIITDGIGDCSSMAATHRVGLILKSRLLEVQEYLALELSCIVKFIHQSMHQRQQIVTRCRTTAREHLHWNLTTPKLLKAYRDVLQPTTRATNLAPQQLFEKALPGHREVSAEGLKCTPFCQ